MLRKSYLQVKEGLGTILVIAALPVGFYAAFRVLHWIFVEGFTSARTTALGWAFFTAILGYMGWSMAGGAREELRKIEDAENQAKQAACEHEWEIAPAVDGAYLVVDGQYHPHESNELYCSTCLARKPVSNLEEESADELDTRGHLEKDPEQSPEPENLGNDTESGAESEKLYFLRWNKVHFSHDKKITLCGRRPPEHLWRYPIPDYVKEKGRDTIEFIVKQNNTCAKCAVRARRV